MSDVESDEDEGLTESDPEIEEENGTNKHTGQPHQRKFYTVFSLLQDVHFEHQN